MTDWHHDAACLDVDPETFFRTDAASVAEAKAICAGCPVASACLADALAHFEQDGVWGGRLMGARDTTRGTYQKRPSHCLACQRAMRARHAPPDGRVQYQGRGLCTTCYTRRRFARRTA